MSKLITVFVFCFLTSFVIAQDIRIEVNDWEVGDSTDIQLIQKRYPDKYITSFQVIRHDIPEPNQSSSESLKTRSYPVKSYRDMQRKRYRKVRMKKRCGCSYIGQCYYK